jgi:hypothetical protein
MTIDSRLAAVSSILPSDKAQLLAFTVHGLPNPDDSNPSLVIVQAISKLESSGQLSQQQAQSLREALKIAEISNDNAALIKAVNDKETVDSLRDFNVQFDHSELDHAASPTTLPPITPDKAQSTSGNQPAPSSKVTNNPSAAELPTPIAGPPGGDEAPPNYSGINEGTASAPDDGATQSGDTSQDKAPTIEVNAEDTESSAAEI